MKKIITLGALTMLCSFAVAHDNGNRPFIQLGAGIGVSGTSLSILSSNPYTFVPHTEQDLKKTPQVKVRLFETQPVPQLNLGFGYEFAASDLRVGANLSYLGRLNELTFESQGVSTSPIALRTHLISVDAFVQKAFLLTTIKTLPLKFVLGGKIGTSIAILASQEAFASARGLHAGVDLGARLNLSEHIAIDALVPLELSGVGVLKGITPGSWTAYYNTGLNLNLSYRF